MIYILADTSDWRVQIVSGNVEIGYGGRIVLYTGQRTLLQIDVKQGGRTGDTVTISPALQGSTMPSLSLVLSAAILGKSSTIIDITDYVRAIGHDMIGIYYKLVASTLLRFTLHAGVHPAALMTERRDFVDFAAHGTGSVWATAPMPIYARMPDMIYAGNAACPSVLEIGAFWEPTPSVRWDLQTQLEYISAAAHMKQGAADVPLAHFVTKTAYGQSFTDIKIGTHTATVLTSSYLTYTHVKLQHLTLTADTGADIEFNADIPAGAASYSDWQVVPLRQQECGTDYAYCRWQSRSGNEIASLWQVVKKSDNVHEDIQLQTLGSGYSGLRGFEEGLTLRLDRLTAYDVWYYGSVISSPYLQVSLRLDGVFQSAQVVTKSLSVPDDKGFYTLDVEIKVAHYDAI